MVSRKLLLVDDEPDNTTILKVGLESHGFTVDVFNDPTRAIAEYKPNYHDFHVLDIRMPGISGFDLARQIWELDPKAHVCFLSAFEIYEEEANKVFKSHNTNCFIKKPMTPRALAMHLQEHEILKH